MSKAKTLLIVDDSKVSRMMISQIVKKKHPDWKLVEASNGEEALEKSTALEIDYYSIDLNMPIMDGLELMMLLKDKSPPSHMTLMTANVQETVASQVQQLGANCVHKPITEESVSKMLSYFNG